MLSEELENAYARLGNEYKNTTPAVNINERLARAKASAVGAQELGFVKKDMHGATVSLETLKGKYVLLDFWGSWCGPCRASHPHLKALYDKYRDRGLEIVGIDEEKVADMTRRDELWRGAVAKDGLNWIQVLNNGDGDSADVVKLYGVTAFPTKILLDKDGKILGRFVGNLPDELDKQLDIVFSSSAKGE